MSGGETIPAGLTEIGYTNFRKKAKQEYQMVCTSRHKKQASVVKVRVGGAYDLIFLKILFEEYWGCAFPKSKCQPSGFSYIKNLSTIQ